MKEDTKIIISVVCWLMFYAIVIGGIIYFLLLMNGYAEKEYQDCLKGDLKKCSDSQWCEIHKGGRWIDGGFSAGRCEM